MISFLRWLIWAVGLVLFAASLPSAASGQTYNELISFNGNTAAGPLSPLAQGIDGALYGTTQVGGTGKCSGNPGVGCGIVFKLTRGGQFQILYNFQNNGFFYPANGLVLGDDGDIYGTEGGGAGAIFKITTGGNFTTVHTFQNGPNGAGLGGGLTLGVDGNFYGTTLFGGTPSNSCPNGCGTIYKLTTAGVLTTLYSFCPQNYCPDGELPGGTLAEGPDGNFYGTTSQGGLYRDGTIFKITPSGSFTLLYTFSGSSPSGNGLILASDGNLYGTTDGGNVYRITQQGVYTNLAGLGGALNSLIQGSDGNLYGSTENSGSGYGVLFQMALNGQPSIFYNFVGYPSDGSDPRSGLVQYTNGKFYGTTYTGGGSPCNYGQNPGCGTVFSVDMGLAPFVTFVNRVAGVGRRFGILGQDFTGTMSVSLNGTPATYTVNSDTLIIAIVPAGASTGNVTVTTPSGVLTSNIQFYVIP